MSTCNTRPAHWWKYYFVLMESLIHQTNYLFIFDLLIGKKCTVLGVLQMYNFDIIQNYSNLLFPVPFKANTCIYISIIQTCH